jgi:hypothetical protein
MDLASSGLMLFAKRVADDSCARRLLLQTKRANPVLPYAFFTPVDSRFVAEFVSIIVCCQVHGQTDMGMTLLIPRAPLYITCSCCCENLLWKSTERHAAETAAAAGHPCFIVHVEASTCAAARSNWGTSTTSKVQMQFHSNRIEFGWGCPGGKLFHTCRKLDFRVFRTPFRTAGPSQTKEHLVSEQFEPGGLDPDGRVG